MISKHPCCFYEQCQHTSCNPKGNILRSVETYSIQVGINGEKPECFKEKYNELSTNTV